MGPGMTLNHNTLSTILVFLGIRNLHIHFDSSNERIDAAYEQNGQHIERKITFKEIETAFSSSGSANVEGPARDERDPAGGVTG